MARAGITYGQVVEAANQLKAAGKNPTIEQVRAILKTGSSTTISNHLREWKERESDVSLLSSKENIPEELVGTLKGLWSRVRDKAQESIDVMQTEHKAYKEEIEAELAKYKTNNQRWQSMFNQWTKEKEHLEFEKEEHLTTIKAQDAKIQELAADDRAHRQHLQEKKDHLNELQRLLKQTQSNLEHYRESTREQRLIEQREFQKQKQELTQDLQHMTKERNQLKDNFLELKQIEKQLLAQLKQATNDTQKLRQSFEETQRQNQKFAIQLEAERKESERLNKQLKTLENRLDQQANDIVEYKTQIKLLSKDLTKETKQLQIMSDEKKALAHENWILHKEKSQLEGEIKRLDKIKRAK